MCLTDRKPKRADIYFLVKSWAGEFVNKEPEKCSEFVWASVNDLPKDVISASRISLDLGLKGVVFSELWE